jgi:transposase-like protein
MIAPTDCPHCGSHDIRRLTAAVSGVWGFRCQTCAKIFYVASADVTQRIRDAQTARNRSEPDKSRTADRGDH